MCGYDRCVINLGFHHVDPSRKAFAISTSSGKSLAAYREEAKKCVLVCANCHGEIEAGLIPSPPPGARWRGEDGAHTPCTSAGHEAIILENPVLDQGEA